MSDTITKKRKVLFFIVLGAILLTLLYTWIKFIFTNNVANFSHYLGLITFLPIVYFLFIKKDIVKAIILTGAYLILATINLISFFPFVITSSLGISISSIKIWMPRFNGYALLYLVLYSILNFDTLTEIYLDYKESKGQL